MNSARLRTGLNIIGGGLTGWGANKLGGLPLMALIIGVELSVLSLVLMFYEHALEMRKFRHGDIRTLVEAGKANE